MYDTHTVGNYALKYTVTDASGNIAVPVTRTVQVVDTTPPVITVGEPLSNDVSEIEITVGTTFYKPGATAKDACEGLVEVETLGNVKTDVSGTYTLLYKAVDSFGNQAQVEKKVKVVEKGEEV